jgi:membrane-bound metal-dependent hydrolase YbcI (DUF457 family)
MFIGHNAVGFASKRAAPRTSLGWLMAAPMFLDLIWPIFLILGIEHVRIDPGNTRFTPLDFYDYPWSHSLLMSIVWGAAFGGVFWLRTRITRDAFVLGLGVVSHWILDFVTHRADMPLYPGGPTVGLGLWNTNAAIPIEVALFAAGIAIYLRATRARDRVGSVALWAFIVLLAIIYAANAMGPPPPSVDAIKWLALIAWLLPFWCAWIDRHREARD